MKTIELQQTTITAQTVIIEVPHTKPVKAYSCMALVHSQTTDYDEYDHDLNDLHSCLIFNEEKTHAGNLQAAIDYMAARKEHHKYIQIMTALDEVER